MKERLPPDFLNPPVKLFAHINSLNMATGAGLLALIAARAQRFVRQHTCATAVFLLCLIFSLHSASLRTGHGITQSVRHSGKQITVAVLILADSRKARWGPLSKVRSAVIAPILSWRPHSCRNTELHRTRYRHG